MSEVQVTISRPVQPALRPIALATFALMLCLLIAGCDRDKRGKTPPGVASVPQAGTATPANLETVTQLCGKCHLTPQPEILSQQDWRKTILDMTKMSGFTLFYPDRPAIQDVIEWYVARAPKLAPLPQGVMEDDLREHTFTSASYPLQENDDEQLISSVRTFALFEDAARDQLVVGDMKSGGVFLAELPAGESLSFRRLATLDHPARINAVDLDRDGKQDLLAADLGSFLPADHDRGKVAWLKQLGDEQFESIELAAGMGRVADVQAGDFDRDGDFDLIVAEFGWRLTGHVILLVNETTDWSNPQFVPQIVDGRNGAVRVEVLDLNGDGLLDFLALVAQGHEMVVAYLNRGNLRFEAKILHRAPHPAWGYCTMDLADLDGDGDIDVILGNGDTLDNSSLKPFYGIGWLENLGELEYQYHHICEMFGVMALQSGDMNNDGRLDIAAAAFFPSRPESQETALVLPTLIWLEQTVEGNFRRHVLEVNRANHLSLTLFGQTSAGQKELILGQRYPNENPESNAIEIWSETTQEQQ